MELIHGAARFAWANRFELMRAENGDLIRDRQGNTDTWRMWWNRKFGLSLGTDLTSYAREHGIGD